MKADDQALHRRTDKIRLIKQSTRREMPPPVRIFRDRRRVEKAHRQHYGDES